MTRISLVAIVSITGLLSALSSTAAYAPAPAPAVQQSTSDLTLKMLSHFKKVFSAAASATDAATAQKAVATITNELKQVDTLTPLLAKAQKATDAEMAIVAEATASMETEMSELIGTMARNLKNKDVRNLISPSMKQFSDKAAKARATMDRLYPVDKMVPLVKAAKARSEIQQAK